MGIFDQKFLNYARSCHRYGINIRFLPPFSGNFIAVHFEFFLLQHFSFTVFGPNHDSCPLNYYCHATFSKRFLTFICLKCTGNHECAWVEQLEPLTNEGRLALNHYHTQFSLVQIKRSNFFTTMCLLRIQTLPDFPNDIFHKISRFWIVIELQAFTFSQNENWDFWKSKILCDSIIYQIQSS